MKNVISKYSIFVWKNSKKIITNNYQIRKWLESESFQTQKSFFLSSSSVYRDSQIPLTESNINLENDIDKNEKYTLENLLTSLMKQKNRQHINLRISNVYGENLEYGIINSLIESCKNRTYVNLFNNLNVVRDYVSLGDVLYAIQELTKLDLSFTALNISTGIGTSIHKILEIFSKFEHPVSKYITVETPIDIKLNSVLNCSALASIIQWNPTKLQDGIFNLCSD